MKQSGVEIDMMGPGLPLLDYNRSLGRPGPRAGRHLGASTHPVVTMALVSLSFLTGGRVMWGQATTSVRGTVTDSSGAAVPGAAVVLANAESKTERTATTGGHGEYQFLLLPPGTYTLSVTASGFARYYQTGLELLVNTPARANVQLKVGQMTQSVTVSSEGPALNTSDASIGNSFGETRVKQFPLEGRNVPDLLSLQADIDKNQDTRNGAVNGARSDQSNLTLDGVDVDDQSNGYAFTSVLPVTLDSVEEFRVTTTNYNADQGDGSGPKSRWSPRAARTRFTGRFTNTFATPQLAPTTTELNTGQPNEAPKLIRNIFGGSLGGPIRKDRVFFFGNYEGTSMVSLPKPLSFFPFSD